MRATEFGLETQAREEMIDITARIVDLIKEQGWREGLLYVEVPHTTAGICVHENANPAVARDTLAALARMAPQAGDYAAGEGNSDAHVKSVLLGNRITLAVVGGRLQLGRWEGIFVAEFDGPRARKLRLFFLEG